MTVATRATTLSLLPGYCRRMAWWLLDGLWIFVAYWFLPYPTWDRYHQAIARHYL